MRIAMVIAAVAATAMAASAFAQPAPGGGRGPAQTPEQQAAAFKAADTNGDGKLDKAEFAATLPEQFRAMVDQVFPGRDTNSDGFISAEENAAPRGGRGGPGGPGGGRGPGG